jgi:hypothetical protein
MSLPTIKLMGLFFEAKEFLGYQSSKLDMERDIADRVVVSLVNAFRDEYESVPLFT